MQRYYMIGQGFRTRIQGCDDHEAAAFMSTACKPCPLKQDRALSERVLQTFQKDSPQYLQIPKRHRFISRVNSWWKDNLALFGPGSCSQDMIEFERIRPMPEETRELLLIDEFCPEELKEKVRAHPTNDDCLIRPYLGRTLSYPYWHWNWSSCGYERDPKTDPKCYLRDFHLYADQLEELCIEVDLEIYARTITETLGILHWGVGTDAMGVEFVLAPPRAGSARTVTNELGEHTVWLLDFNACRDLEMDDDGMESAAKVIFTSPFCPQPGQWLWGAFSNAYLSAGTKRTKKKHLPNLVIEKVEKMQQNEDIMAVEEKRAKYARCIQTR